MFTRDKIKYIPVLLICLFFFFFYSTLSLVKHDHYLTGYDLGVEDQGVWSYSVFKNPLSTTHAYTATPIYFDHVELIYVFIAPFYWIWSDVRLFIILYVLALVLSAVPMYLLAREKKLPEHQAVTLTGIYLLFYGIQNAIWFDVHSIGFGVCFLAWFVYFLYKGNTKPALLFFLLAITSKEDIALLTLLLSLVMYFFQRTKNALYFTLGSVVYLVFIFGMYFPHMTPGYRFQNHNGLLHDTNPLYLVNTVDKRQVLFYSLASFGFLPLLLPLMLVPFLGDLAHFFVIGNSSVTSAQGMFGHYRVTLALLLCFPTIFALAKYKKLQHPAISLYLIGCALTLQYILHLPLSYLAKSWFWHTPVGAKTIPLVTNDIPSNTAIVTQNNITPHFTHREFIYTLWPEKKTFDKNSPCGQTACDWFHWGGNPTYLIVDTSPDWDIRHYLATREDYMKGLENIEKAGIVKKDKEIGTTIRYKILKNPSSLLPIK